MRAVALAVLLLACLPRAWAKEPEPVPIPVYRLNPPVDAALLSFTLVGIAASYSITKALITPSCPCDRTEVNAFDRTVIGFDSTVAERLSDYTLALSLLGGILLDYGDAGASSVFVDDMVVYAEALAVSGALTTLSKYLVRRPIPLVYDPHSGIRVDDPSNYRAFWSGHTSTAFAALTTASSTFTRRHPGAVWPWMVTALVGTSVAVERVLAGRHFYTDVLAAAAAGTMVGLLVPWAHALPPGVGRVSFSPTEGGMQLSWASRF